MKDLLYPEDNNYYLYMEEPYITSKDIQLNSFKRKNYKVFNFKKGLNNKYYIVFILNYINLYDENQDTILISNYDELIKIRNNTNLLRNLINKNHIEVKKYNNNDDLNYNIDDLNYNIDDIFIENIDILDHNKKIINDNKVYKYSSKYYLLINKQYIIKNNINLISTNLISKYFKIYDSNYNLINNIDENNINYYKKYYLVSDNYQDKYLIFNNNNNIIYFKNNLIDELKGDLKEIKEKLFEKQKIIFKSLINPLNDINVFSDNFIYALIEFRKIGASPYWVKQQTGKTYRQYIVEYLTEKDILILKSGTGTGKTTQVVPLMFEAFPKIIENMDTKDFNGNSINYKQKKILCLQPTQFTVIDNNPTISKGIDAYREKEIYVGYSYGEGNDNKLITEDTMIEVSTAGKFKEKLVNIDFEDNNDIQNKLLDTYWCIIIDEAHMRALEYDFILSILSRIKNIIKNKLKIIIMSATINIDIYSNF